jgi:hypothetical protein
MHLVFHTLCGAAPAGFKFSESCPYILWLHCQWQYDAKQHTLGMPYSNAACCTLPPKQAAYPWSSSKVILDVGGGRGELLSAAMSWAGPEVKGLLLDVDMVIKR